MSLENIVRNYGIYTMVFAVFLYLIQIKSYKGNILSEIVTELFLWPLELKMFEIRY